MERLTLGLGGIFGFAIIAIWIAFAVGWVLNIWKLLSVAIRNFTGNEVEVIIRAVGVFFAPLGGVAGYF